MFRGSCNQGGLSLVELMIGLTLGLLLTSGIIMMFISSKTVYITHQALSQVQETGRLAMEFLEKDIRMAGYVGCATGVTGLTVSNTLNQSSDFDYNFEEAVHGYTEESLPGSTFDHTPASGTDIIVVRSADGDGVEVTKNNDSAQIFVNDLGEETDICAGTKNRVSGICPGNIVVVSDCSKARIFQVSQIQTAAGVANLVHSNGNIYSPGNAVSSWGGSTTDLQENFAPGAEVMLATNSAYFIATGTSGRLSLWKNLNGSDLELLDGVENLAITYGEDTDSPEDYVPNEYRKADDVVDWNNVVAVRVELVVASIDDNVLSEAQQYSFDDDTISPPDRRLRQVFTNTIGIRSRLH